MHKVTKSIILSLTLFLLLGITFFINNLMHESTHKVIYLYTGCKEVNLEFTNYGITGTAQCLNYAPRTEELKNTEVLLHGINEVVAYNLTTVLIFFTFIANIFGYLIIWKR